MKGRNDQQLHLFELRKQTNLGKSNRPLNPSRQTHWERVIPQETPRYVLLRGCAAHWQAAQWLALDWFEDYFVAALGQVYLRVIR